MSNTNTGGSAFTQQLESNRDGFAITGGMTMRDYFAASVDVSIYQPLVMLKNKINRDPTVAELAAYIADIRMVEADALLKAREA